MGKQFAIDQGYHTIAVAISANVKNVGSFEKDPHQICQGLRIKSVLEEISILLASVIE